MSTMDGRLLLISELFGPTVQGEGPSAGQQATFIRTSRCNLSCPRCDTPYTWDTTRFDLRAETQRLTVREVTNWALSTPARLVVLTGGEPMLQQEELTPVVVELAAAGRRVEVETNGTIAPAGPFSAAVSGFNVSPKLTFFAAQTDVQRRIKPDVLRAFAATGKAVFKFVAASENDLDEIAVLERELGLTPIWVMPEGDTSAAMLQRMRLIADGVVRRGWHLSSRLQTLIWEGRHGR